MHVSGGSRAFSGIKTLDPEQEVLARGAAYLLQDTDLQAARKSALRFLHAGQLHDEPGLLISRERPSDLITLAAETDFDLRKAHERKQVKVLRLPRQSPRDTDALAQTLSALIALVKTQRPQRVVIDNIASFITFPTLFQCDEVLGPLFQALGPLQATLLITAGPPSTPEADTCLNHLSTRVAGVLPASFAETAPPVLAPLAPSPPASPADTIPLASSLGWPETPSGDGLSETLPIPPRADPLGREAFRVLVQERFHRYAVSGTPFGIVALRSEQPDANTLNFSLFCACIRGLLGAQDAWLVDAAERRMLVLLGQGRATDTQRFFARLKARLLNADAAHADAYLHHITAIVLPNGGSFDTAEDLLAAALDEG